MNQSQAHQVVRCAVSAKVAFCRSGVQCSEVFCVSRTQCPHSNCSSCSYSFTASLRHGVILQARRDMVGGNSCNRVTNGVAVVAAVAEANRVK